MRDLIRFLFDNPIVLVLLVTWLLGLVGKVVQTASQKAKRAAQPGAGGPPPVPPQAQRKVSAEEALAEMRRILGEQQKAQQRPQPTPPPVPRAEPLRQTLRPQPQRRPVAPPSRSAERPPQPVRPSSLGRMGTRVDPHVGEGVQRRQTPASGAVGHSDLGGLGGRTAQHSAVRQRRRGLLDLSDLKRAVVLREVLGPPVALREGWGEPGGAGRVE